MKMRKKPLIITVLSLVLCLSLVIGFTHRMSLTAHAVEITAGVSGMTSGGLGVSQPQDNVYTFDAGAQIRIMGWHGAWGDYPTPWEDPSDTWWNNAVSTYDPTSHKWKTEPYMRWQNGENLPHHFLGCWPADFVDPNTDDLTAVPIKLTGDYQKDDILVAQWSGTRPDDNTARLNFKHLLSRFDVHLHFRDEYTSVSNISVHTNLANEATVNLFTGEATSQGGSGGITMQDRPYPDANWDWSGTCITVPQTSDDLVLTLTFTANGEEKVITYKHNNALTFKPGERVTLFLEVGKNQLKLMETTVFDWDNHNINAGEAEEE